MLKCHEELYNENFGRNKRKGECAHTLQLNSGDTTGVQSSWIEKNEISRMTQQYKKVGEQISPLDSSRSLE